MKKVIVRFSDIKIGDKFHQDGNIYTKKSTRTAYLSEIRCFYFGKNELVAKV